MMTTAVVAARTLIDHLPDRGYLPDEDTPVFFCASRTAPGRGTVTVVVSDTDTLIIAKNPVTGIECFSALLDAETPADVVLTVLSAIDAEWFGAGITTAECSHGGDCTLHPGPAGLHNYDDAAFFAGGMSHREDRIADQNDE